MLELSDVSQMTVKTAVKITAVTSFREVARLWLVEIAFPVAVEKTTAGKSQNDGIVLPQILANIVEVTFQHCESLGKSSIFDWKRFK